MGNNMIQPLINLGSPRRFYYFCEKLFPWFLTASLLAIAYGVIAGLFIAPSDYQQGEGYRIIYVHVPCAMLSLLIYVGMALFSMLYLIWRVKIADTLAFCLAPIGAFFTLIALVTGAIWGKPMWGTWWIWDARLTSELILLFLYLGYLGLYHALTNPKTAAKASAIFALVGVIDIPIIHYSVTWWNTLHQGATIAKWGQPNIAMSMLVPLLAMIFGLAFYTLAILCVRVKTEILRREASNRWVSILVEKGS
ncbi:MAG: heme ABC transporter permease [Candidatus Berkiellales bacterium]